MDGDGRGYTLGLNLIAPEGWSGLILLRSADLNRGGAVPDTRNTVAQEPVDLKNIELSVSLPLQRVDLALGAGYDVATVEQTDEQDSEFRGFLTLQYRF
jgi:hypothetical protein